MPLPNKKSKESKQEFVSRCMSDTKIKKEFPDSSKRLAICLSKTSAHLDLCAIDDHYYMSNYGYTEELTENNFFVPDDDQYLDFAESSEEYDISVAKPGLWENIRKKKEREGKKYKPAKPGDKDRPDPEAWKKAQKKSDAVYEYVDTYTGEVYRYNRRGTFRKDGRPLSYKGKAAEYQGRKVQLSKPFRTPDGPKKFSVYVKNDKGNVVKVNFGDPNMKIKKNIPERRKSFRARHNCDNPGPKWKARYWSCKAW